MAVDLWRIRVRRVTGFERDGQALRRWHWEVVGPSPEYEWPLGVAPTTCPSASGFAPTRGRAYSRAQRATRALWKAQVEAERGPDDGVVEYDWNPERGYGIAKNGRMIW